MPSIVARLWTRSIVPIYESENHGEGSDQQAELRNVHENSAHQVNAASCGTIHLTSRLTPTLNIEIPIDTVAGDRRRSWRPIRLARALAIGGNDVVPGRGQERRQEPHELSLNKRRRCGPKPPRRVLGNLVVGREIDPTAVAATTKRGQKADND